MSELLGWGYSLEHLREAPCGRGFLTAWWLYYQGAQLKGESQMGLYSFYDQVSEVTWPQFCHTPWAVAVMSRPPPPPRQDYGSQC